MSGVGLLYFLLGALVAVLSRAAPAHMSNTGYARNAERAQGNSLKGSVRDRLITETSTIDPLARLWLRPDGTYCVAPGPRPSPLPGYTLSLFGVVSVAAFLTPFVLIRSRGPGMRARRRRRRTAAVAAFFVPVLLLGPQALATLHQQAALYRAVAAGAVGQTGPPTTVTTYAYDDNGNLISRTVDGVLEEEYTYDAENRLVRYDPQFGFASIVSYAYDADGVRTSKSVGGQTIYYLTDKNRPYAQVLEERDGDGALIVRYTYGHDLICQTRGSDTHYYQYDGQMSTRRLTDGVPGSPTQGEATDTYTYDAFGNLLASTGTTVNNYLYTGEQYDPDMGFYYLRARYYAQAIGRFITQDTFPGSPFEPVTLHRYLYANADPVDNRDPSGLSVAITLPEISWTMAIQSLLAQIQQTLIAVTALAVLETARNRTFLWHAMDLVILQIAQRYNGGALRTRRSLVPMYFASGLTPLANVLDPTTSPLWIAAGIRTGVLDARTRLAIKAFAIDLGVTLPPKLTQPSRIPVIIQSARAFSFFAGAFGGGIRVRRSLINLPFFRNVYYTTVGETVPPSKYRVR